MKTNKFLLLAMATASLGLSSCDDGDFLTEKPKTIYTTGNAYGTVDQVKANITNLYIHIRYWYQNDKFLKGQGTDVLDTPYFRDTNGGFCNFSKWSSTASSSSKIYDAMYQLVNYANQSLEGYNTPSLTWNSETEKKETYGEIMFFRGYGYLSLGEMFGGVPLVDKFYETLKLDFAPF